MTFEQLQKLINDMLEKHPELANHKVIWMDYWGMELKKIVPQEINGIKFIQLWTR